MEAVEPVKCEVPVSFKAFVAAQLFEREVAYFRPRAVE